jgi:CBS domain-containing membrane protein
MMVEATTATTTVGAWMTVDPLTLSPDDPLDQARVHMLSSRIRHLPVTQGAKLVGMVSARDLVGIADLHGRRAREVMHFPVETTVVDLPVAKAAGHLLLRRFSSLPVVQGSQELIGILTTTDLVRLACTELSERPVANLMTPRPLATIEPETPLDVARLLMKVEHVRHLPVVEGDSLVGFLSDLDVLAVDPGSDLTVAGAMAREVRELSPGMPACEAGRILVRDRIDALPVLDRGHLVGVLSVFDYLRFLACELLSH